MNSHLIELEAYETMLSGSFDNRILINLSIFNSMGMSEVTEWLFLFIFFFNLQRGLSTQVVNAPSEIGCASPYAAFSFTNTSSDEQSNLCPSILTGSFLYRTQGNDAIKCVSGVATKIPNYTKYLSHTLCFTRQIIQHTSLTCPTGYRMVTKAEATSW